MDMYRLNILEQEYITEFDDDNGWQIWDEEGEVLPEYNEIFSEKLLDILNGDKPYDRWDEIVEALDIEIIETEELSFDPYKSVTSKRTVFKDKRNNTYYETFWDKSPYVHLGFPSCGTRVYPKEKTIVVYERV